MVEQTTEEMMLKATGIGGGHLSLEASKADGALVPAGVNSPRRQSFDIVEQAGGREGGIGGRCAVVEGGASSSGGSAIPPGAAKEEEDDEEGFRDGTKGRHLIQRRVSVYDALGGI